MESGKDIHLERTTGCQSASVRHNNGEHLTQLGPTASNMAEGTCPHTSAGLCNTLFTSTINILECTVFQATVIWYNLA